jgi:sugar lactone lactonase YvrE
MDDTAPTSGAGAGTQVTATGCTTEQTLLGEGARWDDRRGELLRVDILAGRVFRDLVTADGILEPVADYTIPGTVGALAPIDGEEGWLVAAGRGFLLLRPDGSRHALEQVAPAGTRMNDGACDPQGRFWAGTLADDRRPGGGTLYRLERDGRVDAVLDGLTISNGLGWSPDGSTMYLVDSGPRLIHAFDFDGDHGTISRQRTLLALPEDVGAPDGMTVDGAGDLWVAVYGGGQVRHYTPSGELIEIVAIPAAQSTSCAFGGATLNQLFVTTGTEGWDDEQRAADPAAGIVYRVDTATAGQAAALFRPDPGWWSTTAPR